MFLWNVSKSSKMQLEIWRGLYPTHFPFFFSYCYCAQATFFITFVAMENAQTVFIVLNTRHRNERNIIKDLLRCKRWPPTKQLHTHILSISARCIFQFVELNAYIVPKWDGPCKVYAEMAKYELKLSQPVEPYLHWCLWIVALRSRAVGWSENPGGWQLVMW